MSFCSNLYWLSLKSQLEGILAKDAKEGSVFSVQKQAGGPSGYDLGLSSTTLLLFISDTLQYLFSHTDSTRLYCYLQPVFLNGRENSKVTLSHCFNSQCSLNPLLEIKSLILCEIFLDVHRGRFLLWYNFITWIYIVWNGRPTPIHDLNNFNPT